MVPKCANPPCPNSFHYLHEGRLFLLEVDPAFSPVDNPTFGDSKTAEFFWLCGACSRSMTLCLDQEGKIVTARLPELTSGKAQEHATISRHNGMLLRSVDTHGCSDATSAGQFSESVDSSSRGRL